MRRAAKHHYRSRRRNNKDSLGGYDDGVLFIVPPVCMMAAHLPLPSLIVLHMLLGAVYISSSTSVTTHLNSLRATSRATQALMSPEEDAIHPDKAFR